MKIMLSLKLIGLSLAIVSSFPSQQTRHISVMSNRVEGEPEVIVRVPVRKEASVTERFVGEECSNASSSYMSLYLLNGKDAATCNDGSAAGYYFRRSTSSKWLIFLEGGWYCSDETSCKLRKIQYPHLTSSRTWNSCKQGKGICSVLSGENPYLYDSNMVYIPYCSSDLWSGTAKRRFLGDESFSFMGSIIVKQVVQLLLDNHNMREASAVLLAGSSAGGTGVFLNVDRVQGYLKSAGSAAIVRGVSDSAWYLKRDFMERVASRCVNPYRCSPVSMLKMGVSLWKPVLPQRCVVDQQRGRDISPNSSRYYHNQRLNGKWKCFFGPVVFSYVLADVFIIQFMFDPIQLKSDYVDLMNYNGNTNSLMQYIKSLYQNLNESFIPVNGLFVTSCYSHAILDSRDWNDVEISHASLPDAIQCWEMNLKKTSEITTDHRNDSVKSYPTSSHLQVQEYHEGADDRRSDFSSADRTLNDDEDYVYDYYTPNYPNDASEVNAITSSQCKQRLFDPCPLPQCNPTCRPFYHSITHVQLNRIEFLKKLGVDIKQIAKNRGLNVEEILRILNQV